MDLVNLTQVLQSASPHVTGCSVPNPADKTTWVVFWDGADQLVDHTAVQTAITAYDPASVNTSQASINSNLADVNVTNAIKLLQGATPAQINTWVQNNVTTLPQAQIAIATILKILAAMLVN